MINYIINTLAILLIFNTINSNPPYLTTQNNWAEEILKTLTLQEKIGQLFIVAAASNFEQPNESLASAMQKSPYKMDENHVTKMIHEYKVGGIIFLFKSDPETQITLTKKYQSLSKIPLMIAQDSEWGLSMRLDMDPKKVVRYPRNMTLGAIQDKQLIYDLGYEVGKQCSAIGVHINFAPVVDVNNNPENPVIHDRSFGDNPENVAQLGSLFAKGLQDARVIACAKHFPGHGDTKDDSHFDLPVIKHDINRLNNIELHPYKKLINNGVGAIMNAHLCIPELDPTPNKPSSMSYAIVTEQLKNKLGFNGLVVTDGLGMQAITKYYKPGELELQAFLAGNDILLCPLDVPGAIKKIEDAIKSGIVTESELDQRVLKILKAKKWAFDNKIKLKNANDFLVRPEAYELQKKLYQSAITIAKNSPDIKFGPELLQNSLIIQIGSLPENKFVNECEKLLSKSARGEPVEPYEHKLKARTLRQAQGERIQQNSKAFQQSNEKLLTCNANMPDQELQTCLQEAREKETVIISIGEMNKFAAKQFGLANDTCSLISELKKLNKQVIVIAYGTPYSLTYFKEADTIIVAYEDAIPMQETAFDILNGTLKASGRLPVNFYLP